MIASITAKERSRTGKGAARQIRREGRIPAVLYGPESDNRLLTLDPQELWKLYQAGALETSVLEVAIDGESNPTKAMVKEYQVHPVRGHFLHADLYSIAMDRPIQIHVPLTMVGSPEGVEEGGILQFVIRDLHIECLPGDIPEELTVDVSHLGIGDSVSVSEIELPENIEVLEEPSRVVASVLSPVKAATVALPEEEEEEEEVPEEELPEGEEAPEEEGEEEAPPEAE